LVTWTLLVPRGGAASMIWPLPMHSATWSVLPRLPQKIRSPALSELYETWVAWTDRTLVLAPMSRPAAAKKMYSVKPEQSKP